jgi:type I restriction enzyme S subunit
MTVGLSFLLDRPVFINQNVFDVNLDETKINKKFVLWYLNLIVRPLFQTTYTSKYLSKDELGRIKIPLIPKPKQDQIVAQIEPIEKKIINSKSQIKEPQEVINKVFAREFGFDLEKFEKIKKEKFFEVDFSNVNTSLIRSTVIQNKSSSSFLKSFLSKNSLFLKDIILKPIKRGKQPEYTEDGIKVIKTLNIQKGKITFEEVQFVSEKFLKDNEKKAGIYQYDLLLTSTGMGRGKFALYEEEEICFADSHVSIIRFNQEKINPNFLNYYCQSFFGIEQLKYIEMQIKGTPEIYETQLNYFQIPDISLKAQQKIVDEIKAELDKQEEIKSKIENERNKIDEIIEKAIE